MRHFSIVMLCLISTSAEAQDAVDDLLAVRDADIRKDQFARCEAMAERYGISVRVRLEKHISRLDIYCDLDEKQRRRLEIGTLGSAKTVGKRFLKQVQATTDLADHKKALAKLAQIQNEMQELLAHPETSSFWLKTVASTLTKEQQRTLETQLAARRAFQTKAWVLRCVDEIDSEILLTIKQRDTLRQALTAWVDKQELPPLERGRRGAWKMLPENLVAELVFPTLDAKRSKLLIAIAPHHLREALTAKEKRRLSGNN